MSANEPIKSYEKTTIGSERNFGIVFATVFGIIAFAPLYHGGSIRYWAIVFGIAFLVCAFAAPWVLRPLNKIWFKFGLLLHHVVNPLIMGILYYGAVVPMGLFLRARKKDILHLKIDKSASSYWIRRDRPAPTPGNMKKQF
jgi:hypothetical protein